MEGATSRAWALATWITGRLDRLSDRRFSVAVSLPGGLLFALALIPAIAAVFGMGFMRIELARGDPGTFVGLRNYASMLDDRNLIASVPLTLGFAALTTLLSLPLALGSALLLTRRFPGAGVLGILMLLPWAVAPVVTGVYWGFIFQGQFGIATAAANALGIASGPVPWLQQTPTAIGVAVMATAWRSAPLLALILLAALRRIPESLYRAARADGASTFATFRFITLPSIRGSLLLAGVLQVIVSLQVFDTIYTLTGGGPGRGTSVLIYYIFEAAFKQLSLGYSAAMAIVLTLLIGLSSLPLVFARLPSRRRQPAAEQAQDADEIRATPFPTSDQRRAVLPAIAISERPAPMPRSSPALRVAAMTRTLGWKSIVAVVALGLCAWSIGPILWIAVASLQHEGAVTSVPISLGAPTLDNFTDLLFESRRGSFGSALPWISGIWTSLQVAIIAALTTVVAGALMAYPLARLNLPFKRAAMVVLIVTQMIPAIVLAIPMLFIFRAVQLDDTVAGLAIVSVAFHLPVIVWLLRSAFEDVPESLEWAAPIDGSSRLGTILRISIPAAAPAILAAGILVVIGTWNEFLFAVVLGNTEAITVMRLIGTVEISSGPTGRAPYTLLAAAGVMAVTPVLLLVAVFHRRIVNGLTEVHVKG